VWGRTAHNGRVPDVTQLLRELNDGDPGALDRLMPVVYAELRRLADSYLRRERTGHSLQPSELVNEAYRRLVQGQAPDFASRGHFYGVAARLMRQILVDHARSKRSSKRGGDRVRLSFDEVVDFGEDKAGALVALNDALSELASENARRAELVELRYFAGLTAEETAQATGLTTTTVYREWRLAEAWLRRALAERRD
jgi:RNA polymerase sigma-70 factor (ECF subfamily)